MDNEGYPTEAELQRIRDWKISLEPGAETPLQFFQWITSECWWMPDWGVIWANEIDELFKKPVIRLYLSTGGWSGNEEVIHEILSNPWLMFSWEQSRAGGHYIYQFSIK